MQPAMSWVQRNTRVISCSRSESPTSLGVCRQQYSSRRPIVFQFPPSKSYHTLQPSTSETRLHFAIPLYVFLRLQMVCILPRYAFALSAFFRWTSDLVSWGTRSP